MSARATYKFVGPLYVPTVTYYIHLDGYLSGAAEYFWYALYAMDTIDNGRKPGGGIAAAFLRGNRLAEFTGSHDSHGDTEYQYTVTCELIEGDWRRRIRHIITAARGPMWGDELEGSILWTGAIEDFILEHQKKEPAQTGENENENNKSNS